MSDMDQDEPPAKCPRCYSERQARILYGFVNITGDLKACLEAGSLFLGGSTIRWDNPDWACQSCGYRWGFSVQSWELIEDERKTKYCRPEDHPLWDDELDA